MPVQPLKTLLIEDEALRRSGSLLNSLMDNSLSLIYVKDAAGRYLLINRRYEEQLSLTRSDILGKTDLDLFDRETAEYFMSNDRRVLESGKKLVCDEQVVINGKLTTFISTKFPIRDELGNIIAVACISMDVSDRTEANARLRASEEKLRKISDSVLEAVVMIDDLGNVVHWNPAAERIFGYSAAEIIGRDAHDILTPPDLRAAAKEGMRNFLKTGGGKAVGNTLELSALRKNGELFPIEISVSAISLDDKHAAVAVIRDISERKRAERELARYREHLQELVAERTQELAEANRRLHEDICRRREAEKSLCQAHHELRVIYDGTADGLLVCEAESKRFLRANAAICRILGYCKEELLSMTAYDLRDPDHEGDVEQLLSEFVSGQRPFIAELPLRRKDGQIIYADITVSPIAYRGQSCILGMVRDTTERKQSQQELERYTQALESSNRQLEAANRRIGEEKQSKELLMAMVSHELRAPLHGILSYASFGLNKAKGEEGGTSQRYFEKIDRSGHELLEMVNDLLNLAKLEAGKEKLEPAETDVYELVASELEEFSLQAAEKSISIECPRPPDAIRANIDACKITRVVRNLVSNAVKFSPLGRKIDVSLRASEGCFSIAVADQGEGIPDDELNIIFGTFSQSRNKRAGGGTGLGLAICREIVTAHRGQIWAENGPQGGAVVTFRIPLDPFQNNALELAGHAIH